MEKTKEIFDVKKCPLCGKRHKYSLAVVRSSFLYGRLTPNISADGEPTKKQVQRLFTCPKTGESFKTTVILKEDPKNKIASITIEGVIKEKK